MCFSLVPKLNSVACSHSVGDEAPLENLISGPKMCALIVDRSSTQKDEVSTLRTLSRLQPPLGQDRASPLLIAAQRDSE